jgi:hypothetical protein
MGVCVCIWVSQRGLGKKSFNFDPRFDPAALSDTPTVDFMIGKWWLGQQAATLPAASIALSQHAPAPHCWERAIDAAGHAKLIPRLQRMREARGVSPY